LPVDFWQRQAVSAPLNEGKKTMIIEIALGIVLAVIILAFLPTIITLGVVAVGIALVIVAVSLVVLAVQFDLAFTSIVVVLLSPVAIVYWRDKKMLAGRRKELGYGGTTDSESSSK
jgi:ABC-type long-subunit fatty acid transport system fused permease/ATPase subunit